MLVTWKYRPRNTLIQRLDPRARLIFMLAALVTLLFFWDMRYELFFFVLALVQYSLARLSFRDTRRAWLLMGPLIVVLTILTFLTGRFHEGVYTQEHMLGRWVVFQRLTIVFSAEKIAFAISQLLRVTSITMLAIVIPYTIDPSLYGVTFRGLGLPDKFAYAMDLAFRLVPSLGRDFSITYDAQRARGYELEKLKGGIVAQIRRVAPLLVPVVIQAIVGGEEVIDSMDLRAFGAGPRTWLPQLRLGRADWLLLTFSVVLVVAGTVLMVTGHGTFWVPEILLQMAQP
jgi:energy-coupling factor transport system permease protein